MTQPVRVLIVEDDQYARTFMSMMIKRDGRIRIAGELAQVTEVSNFLRHSHADLILLGGNRPLIELEQVLRAALGRDASPKVVFTPTYPEQICAVSLEYPACQGCLFKDEIHYGRGWALILAAQGEWVITPGVECLANQSHFSFKHKPLILNGLNAIAGMSAEEAEEARMAFLFYIEDPAGNRTHFSRSLLDHMRKGYQKLNFKQILRGEVFPQEYYANQAALLQYFGEDLEQMWGKIQTMQDQASLAFSLLSIPEVRTGAPVQA